MALNLIIMQVCPCWTREHNVKPPFSNAYLWVILNVLLTVLFPKENFLVVYGHSPYRMQRISPRARTALLPHYGDFKNASFGLIFASSPWSHNSGDRTKTCKRKAKRENNKKDHVKQWKYYKHYTTRPNSQVRSPWPGTDGYEKVIKSATSAWPKTEKTSTQTHIQVKYSLKWEEVKVKAHQRAPATAVLWSRSNYWWRRHLPKKTHPDDQRDGCYKYHLFVVYMGIE